jgi:hypothetical protein
VTAWERSLGAQPGSAAWERSLGAQASCLLLIPRACYGHADSSRVEAAGRMPALPGCAPRSQRLTGFRAGAPRGFVNRPDASLSRAIAFAFFSAARMNFRR